MRGYVFTYPLLVLERRKSMSLVKGIELGVSHKKIKLELPKKKTIILRGSVSETILYVVESLLSNDFTGYNFELDRQYGFNYDRITGECCVNFNEGVIRGRHKTVSIKGEIPKIHCIRYLGACNQLRSFVLAYNSPNFDLVTTDTRKYSPIIDDVYWNRLVGLTNSVIGAEVVTFKDKKLDFKFLEDYPITVEGQQIIYMLIAECFLTPKGYHRVLLLPNIPYLSKEVQLNLLEVLDNIKGHSLTLSTAEVDVLDISGRRAITALNI